MYSIQYIVPADNVLTLVFGRVGWPLMSNDDAATIQFSLRVSANLLRRVVAVQGRLDKGMCGALDPNDNQELRSGVSRCVIMRAAVQRGLKMMESELGMESPEEASG
mgnify:CR=1 FL=1